MDITLEEALKRASFCLHQAGIDNPRSEAELLLAKILGLDRLRLVTKIQDILADPDYKNFEVAWKRRANHEPLAYITGEKYFYGRPFVINSDVLVPRPETELLIDLAVRWFKYDNDLRQGGLRVLDLGTGSGVLAITLALELQAAEVWAVDISHTALNLAGQNAVLHNLGERIKFLQGNYFDPLDRIYPAPRFNLIVSNPPYISAAELPELPATVAQFEPPVALYGGADGLDGYRAILKKAALYAETSALLLVEIGSTQAQSVTELFRKSGLFRMIGCRRDIADHPRAILGLL
jgi:release factor glutamine methyltransferase